jgi:aryl-alcohol dehydrogenase-like predicted oxidoreductase
VWGGWTLFQELLQVLSGIASKRGVSIANVATRWVLDFPYVGAVIVGCRMGVSDHSNESLACFGWTLDDSDRQSIDVVLAKSNREAMFRDMGDCGAEYR